MTPYFSIIMPAYGVEKYIKRSIESIQAQTFSDWELLIIDDCTKDRSAIIAEEMAADDARIRVIHQTTNQGVSEARNRGIQEATGAYLWFVDSDDWVEAEALSKVKAALDKNPAQLTIFGHVEEYPNAQEEVQMSWEVSPGNRLFAKEDLHDLRMEMIELERKTIYGYPWNKIYDLAYLKSLNLQFEDYRKAKFIEDIMFNVAYAMDMTSMNLIPDALYHYAKREGNNLTNEFVPEYYRNHKRRIGTLLAQYKHWNLANDYVKSILGALYTRYIFSALQRNCDKRAQMNAGERRAWCKRLMEEPLVNELIPYAKAQDSKALVLLIKMLQRKQVTGSLLLARAIYIVKNELPMFYSKTKSKR